MSFLKRFTKNRSGDGASGNNSSSFENLTDDQIENHLQIRRYGSFILSEAVRPAYDLSVVPSAGYRRDTYTDSNTGVSIPVFMAAQSREKVMDLFMELLDELGEEVDVVLESSHSQSENGHRDLYREAIDMPVLKSILYDFEDLLVNDGCTGIAVLNPNIPLEVQFDEHKLLILYGQDINGFEPTLCDSGLDEREEIRFITEAEHVHTSSDEFIKKFEQLRYRLGIDD